MNVSVWPFFGGLPVDTCCHRVGQGWPGNTDRRENQLVPTARTFLVALRWQSPGEAEFLPMLRHYVPDYQLWNV